MPGEDDIVDFDEETPPVRDDEPDEAEADGAPVEKPEPSPKSDEVPPKEQ
jgi:hypothetical protein